MKRSRYDITTARVGAIAPAVMLALALSGAVWFFLKKDWFGVGLSGVTIFSSVFLLALLLWPEPRPRSARPERLKSKA